MTWRNRHVLAGVTTAPDWRALGVILLLGLGWLAARIGGVLVIEQYALVGILVATVWLLMGLAMLRAAAFPLAFLLLMVPNGEGLIPHMIEFTADWKYHLPTSHVLANQLSPRYIAEFYERCVNYRFDHGCEFLLEAMRRDQYGFGRLFLPRHITYIGGKTGNYGEWDHESLFFYHGNVPYSIVVFTRGDFSPGKMNWPLGAMIGGLFREYVEGSGSRSWGMTEQVLRAIPTSR